MRRRQITFFSITALFASFSLAACGSVDSSVGSASGAIQGAECGTEGQTAPASDGCNTCTCTDDGAWACTEIGCAPGSGGGDGSGGSSGGSDGSGGDPSGTGSCTYDGKTFQAGDSFPSTDGCNDCGCSDDGSVYCTEKACLCPEPEPLPEGSGCIQVLVWAKDPGSGQCCQYGTPCNAPDGWQQYSSEEECQGAACPAPAASDELCNQVVVWAKDPTTGDCCQYGTPCDAPEDWEQFWTAESCETGAAQ